MKEEIKDHDILRFTESFEVDIISGESMPYFLEGNPFDDIIRVLHRGRFGEGDRFAISARTVLRSLVERDLDNLVASRKEKEALRAKMDKEWWSKDILVRLVRDDDEKGGYLLEFFNEEGTITSVNFIQITEDIIRKMSRYDPNRSRVYWPTARIPSPVRGEVLENFQMYPDWVNLLDVMRIKDKGIERTTHFSEKCRNSGIEVKAFYASENDHRRILGVKVTDIPKVLELLK